ALLDRLAPDVVVTVHATPAAAMSTLARLGNRVPPHTTVVTDFVAHSQWIAPHVDRYCVAADEVRHEYSARGIPEERIVVTGVPVRPEFAEPVSPAAARAALGLSPEMPVVLAMAGSQGGVGRLPDVAHVLRAMRRPLQGIVLAGHDAGLRTALARLTDGTTIRTLGYVEDVRRLMVGAAAAWAAYTWGAHLLTPGCVWRGPATRRRIALTFDDGPDPIWSERILDLLARREVRGSFFLVGERAARAPETVRRIAAADHEIASHGWSHRSLWLCGPHRTE